MSDPNRVQHKLAENAALASLLNLTFLPGVAFIWLLISLQKKNLSEIDHYHQSLAIKLNLLALAMLFFVSLLMLTFGGFASAWTWAFVISYFTLIHSLFIMTAVWAMVRAWSGQRLY